MEGSNTLPGVQARQRSAVGPGAIAVERFRRRTRAALGAGVGICLVVSLAGLPYYAADVGSRLRSPMHAWLKPSGAVGQTLGIVAFAMFAFLWLYPLRKRFRPLSVTGSLARWLDVHIVAGLLVPLFGAVHAGWRFQGIIGLGYACMLTVSLSGIVGRYLYVHLPRSRDGVQLTLAEVDRRGEAIVEQVAEALGENPGHVREALLEQDANRDARRGALGALVDLFAADLARWRWKRRLRRDWSRRRGVDPASVALAVRLAGRRAALVQQARMIHATQRLFRYWHVAHMPIAITGLLAVTVHVVAVVALGVTWFL